VFLRRLSAIIALVFPLALSIAPVQASTSAGRPPVPACAANNPTVVIDPDNKEHELLFVSLHWKKCSTPVTSIAATLTGVDAKNVVHTETVQFGKLPPADHERAIYDLGSNLSDINVQSIVGNYGTANAVTLFSLQPTEAPAAVAPTPGPTPTGAPLKVIPFCGVVLLH
jgi:hypothetical protein